MPWRHQTGLVGSVAVFHSGAAKDVMESLPLKKLNGCVTLTFCTDLPR